ncbi:hypothetical protein ACHQM5_005884 [Ranunculus cassubicifolius]
MSGAKIHVIDDLYADPSSKTRDVILCGRPEHIRKAANLINDIVKEDIAAMYCKNTNKNISHSAPSCGIESFALVDGFKVKLKYHDLYKAMKANYGDLWRPSVLDASEMAVVWIVSDLLSIVHAMCQLSQLNLNVEILDDWDKKISLAEHLNYNVSWLRDQFEELQTEFERKVRIDAGMSEFLNFSEIKQNGLESIEAVISFLTSHLERAKKSSSVLQSEDEDFVADITVEKEEDFTLLVEESSLIPRGFKLVSCLLTSKLCFFFVLMFAMSTMLSE